MLIDWFTTGAQIVNFLILIWLLKRFLYGPILRVMDVREEKIAARLKEAEMRIQEAQRQGQEFEGKRRDLESKREELLSEAREQAEDCRGRLVCQAREETEKLRANWRESVRRERDTFLHELHQRAARHTCDAARQVLAEMADAELERQVLKVWSRRLVQLDEQERAMLRNAASQGEARVLVRTAFDLEADQRRELTRLVGDQVGGEVRVDYQADRDLLCGIELQVGGYKLAWSVDEHLRALQESVNELLERAAQKEPMREAA